MANPALYITDGTTEVSLLRGSLRLVDWTPARAELKGGGTWRSSPFVDGRRLVAFRRDNIVDAFALLVQGYTQNELIYACQEADRLLTKAMQYWTTSWQTEPVYLVARGHGESHARYAHIHSYAFPTADNPYAPPFSEGRGLPLAMEDLTIIIEHGSWLQFPPAEQGCTLISAENDYNERTYGRDSTDVCERIESLYGYILKEDGDHIVLEIGPPDALLLEGLPFEVYVSNKTNVANLTHIWQWAAGPLWANLIDAIPPTTGLFRPAIGANVPTGSYIDFSIETAAHSGPFCSLVFDIDTVATIGVATTLDWVYPTGPGAWAPLLVRDNTDMFREGHVNSVHWNPPTDWDETEGTGPAAGTVGYYVRCIVNGNNYTNPSQQNRRIYTITWPRYDVDQADIGGDVVALVRTTADNQASDGASPDLPFNKMWLGLRSIERGSNFVMHLNVADRQNPTGITCTTSNVFTADDTTPSGWHSAFGVNGGALTITWSMNSTIMPEFWGTYHAFVRGKQIDQSSGDVLIQIITQSVFGAATTHLWSSNQVPFQTNNDWELVDMGRVSLPPIGIAHPTFDIFEILVQVVDAGGVTTNVKLYDLILLPIDEWAGSFSNTIVDAEVDEGLFLDVDSISDPKRLITAVNRVAATGNIFTAYQVIANDHALVQANATQRMYHLFADDEISFPCISCAVWLFTNQQYLNMRGDR